jgi:phytoene synthase
MPDPQAQLAHLRTMTARALAGERVGAVPFDALAEVARECDLDRATIDDHLAGFARDADGWRPDSAEDLLSYCYQVAGAVGVLMAQLMGVPRDDADTLDRAADLGIAFQLANIARDIREDAAVGRVYLPRQWLDEAGLDDAALADPARGHEVAPLAARLADMAEPYRLSAQWGATRLPLRSRWAVLSAAWIYGQVARRVKARGARAWDRRVVVHKPEKSWLVSVALAEAAGAPVGPDQPVSREGLWTRPRAGHPAP